MAKQKLEINKKDFQKVVDDLENKQEFENPSALWKAVENTTWAKGLKPRPLTAALAYARAKELGIVIKTKPGKRGRRKGEGMPSTSKRTKGGRSKKMKFYKKTFEGMRISLPMVQKERFEGAIEKAEKGSLRAAIKMKCLDCSGYQPVEVKNCTVTGCPLYPHRPWKHENEGKRMNEFLNGEGEPWQGYYEECDDENTSSSKEAA